jgi:hypothetical protein
MADGQTRKPENVGEVLFKSFGQGLQALSGILETDRQNKLQDLQLQMNMRVQEARLEQLRVSTEMQKEALKLKTETPKETRQRTEDLLTERLLLETGMPTIAPFPTALAGLRQTAENLGMDFDVPTPMGTFEFGGTQPFNIADVLPAGFGESTVTTDLQTGKTKITYKPVAQQFDPDALIAHAQDTADRMGKVIDNINFKSDGSIGSISLGDPTPEKPITPAQVKEGERQERNRIFAEAAEVYRNLPREVKQDLEMGELVNFKDLSRALVNKGIAGKKEGLIGSRIDLLWPDQEGLPEAFARLQELARQHRNVGTATEISDADLDAELKKRGK